MEGLELGHRLGDSFDIPMILLKPVVQVVDREDLNQIGTTNQSQEEVG